MSTETDTTTEQAAAPNLFDITIYLKTGQSFTVRVEDFSIGRNRLTDGLAELNWTNARGGERLRHIEMDQIAAITSRDVPETAQNGR